MSKKKLAFLFVCAATVMACNESVEWNADNACQDGKKTCSGDAVMVCKDGTYTEEQKCSGSTPVCKVDGDSASCVAGETPKPTCTPGCNGNTLVTCDAAGNKTETPCTGDTPVCGKNVIGVDACIAASTVTCTPGCSGTILVTCDAAGNKTETPCTGDTPACGKDGDGNDACIAASTETCTPGCDGDTLVVCTEDGAVDEDKTVDCTETDQICGQDGDGNDACVDDLSNVKCTYGEGEDAIELEVDDIVCDENGKKITCKDDGTMSEAEDCDAGKVCRADTEESPIGDCVDYKSCTIGEGEDAQTITHDTKICSGDKIVVCNDGKLDDVTDCSADDGKKCLIGNDGPACDAVDVNKDCQEGENISKEGTTRCDANGLKIEICTETAFVPVTDNQCDDNQVCRVIKVSDVDTPSCVAKPAVYRTIKSIHEAYASIVDEATCGTKDDVDYKHDTKVEADVEIEGVVTGIRTNSMGFIMQEESADGKYAGMLVYCSDKACVTDLAIGDNVKVTANAVGQYYCQLQVRANDTTGTLTVAKTEKTVKIEPVELDVDKIVDGTKHNDYNGTLVTVYDLTADSFASNTWTMKSGSVTLKLRNYLMALANNTLTKDKLYSVTGVVNYFNENVIYPRSAEDLVELCTDDVCKDGKLQACYFGTLTEPEDCIETFNSTANAKTAKCNTEGNACVIETCADGFALTTEGKCEPSNDCTYEGNKISSGDYYCISETRVGVCNTGTFTEFTAAQMQTVLPQCAAGYKCDSATINTEYDCTIAPACTKDVCADGKIKKCNSGTLADEVACSGITDATTYGCNTAGDACVATACSGDKVPSADGLSCVENTPEPCTDGAVECISETEYKLCISGEWATSSVVTGQKCQSNALVCTLEVICDGTDKYKECKDGSVSDSKAVPGYLKCSGNALVCETEGKFCDGDDVIECISGEADIKDSCSGGQICSEGACITPAGCTDAVSSGTVAHGSVGCKDTKTYAECNNGVWKEGSDVACEGTKVCDPDNELVCKDAGLTSAALFISEYVHGSSNKRAIELYNPTDAEIDLSKCKINYYTNGATTADGASKALTGTLAAKSVYVTCSNSVADTDTDKCNDKNLTATYNGDDAIELVCDSVTLDVIGKIGERPSTAWIKDGVSTANSTLVRKCGIEHGDNVGSDAFDPSAEWTSYAKDTFTNLGSHTAVCSD